MADRALKLLDAICRDSLEVGLDHVDVLKADGILHEYGISALFYELREEIRALASRPEGDDRG